jgi:hypothetical protein
MGITDFLLDQSFVDENLDSVRRTSGRGKKSAFVGEARLKKVRGGREDENESKIMASPHN